MRGPRTGNRAGRAEMCNQFRRSVALREKGKTPRRFPRAGWRRTHLAAAAGAREAGGTPVAARALWQWRAHGCTHVMAGARVLSPAWLVQALTASLYVQHDALSLEKPYI